MTEQSKRSEYDYHNSNYIDRSNSCNNYGKKMIIITAVEKAILQCQRMRYYSENTRRRYNVHPTLGQRRQTSRVHRELQNSAINTSHCVNKKQDY